METAMAVEVSFFGQEYRGRSRCAHPQEEERITQARAR